MLRGPSSADVAQFSLVKKEAQKKKRLSVGRPAMQDMTNATNLPSLPPPLPPSSSTLTLNDDDRERAQLRATKNKELLETKKKLNEPITASKRKSLAGVHNNGAVTSAATPGVLQRVPSIPSAATSSSSSSSSSSNSKPLDLKSLNALFTDCLKLAGANKITSKNTWQLDFIRHMGTMLLNTKDAVGGGKTAAQQRSGGIFDLDKTQIDDGSGDSNQFQKASCSLDASMMIYSTRVDDVHKTTFKVLGGLSNGGQMDDGGDEEGSENPNAAPGEETKKRRARRPGASTLEVNPSKLDIKQLETELTIDPLFHLVTAKFEGGPSGMLMNNLFLYNGVRLGLDSTREYLLTPDDAAGANSSGNERPSRFSSAQEELVYTKRAENELKLNLDFSDLEMKVSESLQKANLESIEDVKISHKINGFIRMKEALIEGKDLSSYDIYNEEEDEKKHDSYEDDLVQAFAPIKLEELQEQASVSQQQEKVMKQQLMEQVKIQQLAMQQAQQAQQAANANAANQDEEFLPSAGGGDDDDLSAPIDAAYDHDGPEDDDDDENDSVGGANLILGAPSDITPSVAASTSSFTSLITSSVAQLDQAIAQEEALNQSIEMMEQMGVGGSGGDDEENEEDGEDGNGERKSVASRASAASTTSASSSSSSSSSSSTSLPQPDLGLLDGLDNNLSSLTTNWAGVRAWKLRSARNAASKTTDGSGVGDSTTSAAAAADSKAKSTAAAKKRAATKAKQLLDFSSVPFTTSIPVAKPTKHAGKRSLQTSLPIISTECDLRQKELLLPEDRYYKLRQLQTLCQKPNIMVKLRRGGAPTKRMSGGMHVVEAEGKNGGSGSEAAADVAVPAVPSQSLALVRVSLGGGVGSVLSVGQHDISHMIDDSEAPLNQLQFADGGAGAGADGGQDDDDDNGGGHSGFDAADDPLSLGDDENPFGGPSSLASAAMLDLITAPTRAEKIEIQYDRVSKIVDVKALKQAMWQGVKETLVDVKIEDASSTIPQTTFQHVINRVPTHFPPRIQHQLPAISTAYCFISMLHLCNEHGLGLVSQEKRSENEEVEQVERQQPFVGGDFLVRQ